MRFIWLRDQHLRLGVFGRPGRISAALAGILGLVETQTTPAYVFNSADGRGLESVVQFYPFHINYLSVVAISYHNFLRREVLSRSKYQDILYLSVA